MSKKRPTAHVHDYEEIILYRGIKHDHANHLTSLTSFITASVFTDRWSSGVCCEFIAILKPERSTVWGLPQFTDNRDHSLPPS